LRYGLETVMGDTRVDAVDQARTIIYECLERDGFRRPTRPDDAWSVRSVALLLVCVLSNVAVIVWALGCATAACR
jgi:hypothetical protein